MPKTIVANIRTVVKDGRIRFERDCESCGATIPLPAVGINDCEALWNFATERGKLCCICAPSVEAELAVWFAGVVAQDARLKPGDWGTGHERQTEAAMIGL